MNKKKNRPIANYWLRRRIYNFHDDDSLFKLDFHGNGEHGVYVYWMESDSLKQQSFEPNPAGLSKAALLVKALIGEVEKPLRLFSDTFIEIGSIRDYFAVVTRPPARHIDLLRTLAKIPSNRLPSDMVCLISIEGLKIKDDDIQQRFLQNLFPGFQRFRTRPADTSDSNAVWDSKPPRYWKGNDETPKIVGLKLELVLRGDSGYECPSVTLLSDGAFLSWIHRAFCGDEKGTKPLGYHLAKGESGTVMLSKENSGRVGNVFTNDALGVIQDERTRRILECYVEEMNKTLRKKPVKRS